MTIRVRMVHIRTAKFCASGARAWFASHNFSWTDFLRDGISVEELEATNDALAFRVTAIAKEEVKNGFGRR